MTNIRSDVLQILQCISSYNGLHTYTNFYLPDLFEKKTDDINKLNR